MSVIDPRILRFIKKHHQFTLATAHGNIPWTANCFYAYQEEANLIIFTSSASTRHGREMLEQTRVAGNIALETNIIGKIQGLQFSGIAFLLESEELERAKRTYLLKFPVAMLMETTLWGIKPDHYKLTDNRLGFGKKLIWDQHPDNQDDLAK